MCVCVSHTEDFYKSAYMQSILGNDIKAEDDKDDKDEIVDVEMTEASGKQRAEVDLSHSPTQSAVNYTEASSKEFKVARNSYAIMRLESLMEAESFNMGRNPGTGRGHPPNHRNTEADARIKRWCDELKEQLDVEIIRADALPGKNDAAAALLEFAQLETIAARRPLIIHSSCWRAMPPTLPMFPLVMLMMSPLDT